MKYVVIPCLHYSVSIQCSPSPWGYFVWKSSFKKLDNISPPPSDKRFVFQFCIFLISLSKKDCKSEDFIFFLSRCIIDICFWYFLKWSIADYCLIFWNVAKSRITAVLYSSFAYLNYICTRWNLVYLLLKSVFVYHVYMLRL